MENKSMELYREGFLNKAGKGIIQTHLHSWRPRYFVFDSSRLKYYKSREISEENLLGCIEIADVESVSYMKHEKPSFQITTKSPKSRTYYMSGKSEDEVGGWVRVLQIAKAKLDNKDETNDNPVSNLGFYDEVKLPPQSLVGPPKPPRTASNPVPSQYSFLGPVTQPAPPPNSTDCSEPCSSSGNAIPSEYECIGPVTQPNRSSSLKDNKSSAAEPISSAYEVIGGRIASNEASSKIVNHDQQPPVSEKRNTDQMADSLYDEPSVGCDLYDTVRDVDVRTISPSVSRPPPLPTRHPSLSLEMDGETDETSEARFGEKIPVRETGSRDGGIPMDQVSPMGIYDEIRITPAGLNDPERTKDDTKMENQRGSDVDKKDSVTLPVYAKPMRKKSSKYKLNPALIDIGEVSVDVEEDSAGGRDSLKKGMTTPIGDRFAVEEIKTLLETYEEVNNNNGGTETGVDDFDLNQCESAFDLLKRFVEKYQ